MNGFEVWWWTCPPRLRVAFVALLLASPVAARVMFELGRAAA